MNSLFKEIIRIENLMDAELPRPRFDKPISKELVNLRNIWVNTIFELARNSAPIHVSEAEIQKGLNLIQYPVFICGTHRSGTTFFHDLLDGHPNLMVLPTEGNFYEFLLPKLKKKSENEKIRLTVVDWLIKLVIKSGQEPYWELGRSTEAYSPYLEFVRYFIYWWEIAKSHFKGNEILPLLAISLAYSSVTGKGKIDSQWAFWVEKSPNNEFNISRITRLLPKARFIILIRNPLHVYASRKKIEETQIGSFESKYNTIFHLVKSHKIAARNRYPEKAVLVIKYEKLVDSQEDTMHKVCNFLGIIIQPNLQNPTNNSVPAFPNSSFSTEKSEDKGVVKRNYQNSLPINDKITLNALTLGTNRVFGYDYHEVSQLSVGYISLKLWVNYMIFKIKNKILRMTGYRS